MATKRKETFYNFPSPIYNRNLVGHNDVLRSFDDAWKKRNEYPVHPVWLLTGQRGIGKATLAYELTRRIFSDLMGHDAAEQMSAGGIGDFFIVDLEHNVGDANRKTISVDTVRLMIEHLQMSSMAESWRVVIIDSMDELSRGTENALLKTLEEPPAKTIFFLIAHSLDGVLPTIRSRSRIEKMRPLSPMELREIAANLLPEGTEISDNLIKLGGGCFGRIANLLVTGADTLFNDVMDFISDSMMNSSDALALSKRIAANPENISILLDAIHELNLAELYPQAARDIDLMNALHLDPDLVAFKILMEIKKCHS